MKYKILNKEEFLDYKLSFDIEIPDKISADKIKKIANKIYKKYKGVKYRKVFICYYLPGMLLNAGAWATSHFNPILEININSYILKFNPPKKENVNVG